MFQGSIWGRFFGVESSELKAKAERRRRDPRFIRVAFWKVRGWAVFFLMSLRFGTSDCSSDISPKSQSRVYVRLYDTAVKLTKPWSPVTLQVC